MKKIELMENITIVNHETNLYDLISQSKSVVGFPFVSPAVIAKEMDTPVVYYSSSDIMATYSKFHGVQVVQSLKGLQRFLKKFLI
jgi:polysaccharide biosynthesis PFTS motif protein